MEFIYDSSRSLLGFTYGGETYFYIKNLQGDITNIVDDSGNIVASYEYSAFGESYCAYSASNDIGYKNPMRYRDYYFDEEMTWYYLQSRYYVPTWGRFLNSDLPEYAQAQKSDQVGLNLFAYCCNNPVNNEDNTGYWGADIHYGKARSNPLIIGEYNGTYEWLTVDTYGIELSAYFADGVASGNAFMDEDPDTTPTLNSDSKCSLAERQKYHFNRNPSGYADSRVEWGLKYFNESVKAYNKAVRTYRKRIEEAKDNYAKGTSAYNEAIEKAKNVLKANIYISLFILGQAMHCFQDIYAHGNISAGPVEDKHIARIFGHVHDMPADDPYFKWTDNKKNYVELCIVDNKRSLSRRYINTRKRTISIFKKFRKQVINRKYLRKQYWGDE